jgi:putative Holliday junction resolvase
MGGAIGVDVGTQTIGLAAMDALGMLAHPVTTLPRKSVIRDADAIVEVARARGCSQLVVGLPLELDGTEARSARLARQIGERLAAVSGLPVSYVDERFSSVEAEARLVQADVSRAKRKLVIDQWAAVIILERWQQEVRASSLGG